MAEPGDFLVLVVDDEEDILAYLGTALEDAGFRVVTARDGREALEVVRCRRPDFISLDVVMPGGSGIGFLHELRRQRGWSTIPVMMVTGHARDELGRADLAKALEEKLLSGPGAYLEKPVTAEGFVGAVCQALGVRAPAGGGVSQAQSSRDEAEKLLREASPERIEEVLRLLRRI